MFETDRIPSGWEIRLNKMDQVWVPSAWAVETFAAGGVQREKLVVIPEPVDTGFFNPELYEPLELKWQSPGHYRFISIFKWEARKGWDVLLRAFFEEFKRLDDVSLHILTHGYHATKSETSAVQEFIEENGFDQTGLPRLELITQHIPTMHLPRLYKAADAFVLPSRGEGWGRPHVEAMAMGLPIISTYWSGPTEFMTHNNSFPLEIEPELVPLPKDSAFQGHKWADPSVQHLRKLMRKLVQNPDLGRKVGMQARADMIQRYSPAKVATLIADHIKSTTYSQIDGDGASNSVSNAQTIGNKGSDPIKMARKNREQRLRNGFTLN